MMKSTIVITFIFCLGLSGCVASLESMRHESSPRMWTMDSPVDQNRTRLNRIRRQMDKDDVQALLDDVVVIGYILPQEGDTYEPKTITNPYKVELISLADHSLTVHYYLYEINHSDGIIADDELFPVLFDNEQVIGLGWDDVLTVKGQHSSDS